jgi:hypothetical protein
MCWISFTLVSIPRGRSYLRSGYVGDSVFIRRRRQIFGILVSLAVRSSNADEFGHFLSLARTSNVSHLPIATKKEYYSTQNLHLQDSNPHSWFLRSVNKTCWANWPLLPTSYKAGDLPLGQTWVCVLQVGWERGGLLGI